MVVRFRYRKVQHPSIPLSQMDIENFVNKNHPQTHKHIPLIVINFTLWLVLCHKLLEKCDIGFD